jgi:S1-C subfamily serine protease
MKSNSIYFALITAIALVHLPMSILAQGLVPNAEDVTFISTQLVAAQDKKSVFAVQLGQMKPDGNISCSTIGTGFFVDGTRTTVNGLLTNFTSVVLGVTCNHVVNAVVSPNLLFIGLDTKQGYKRVPCKVIYTDSTNDIAIIAPTPPKTVSTDEIGFQDLMIGTNMFDDGTLLVEGKGVVIIGYPLALGLNGDKNHPIIRFGIIAQSTEENTFLIDGMVSHGNSGSPVIILTPTKQPLVGMITSFENDQISLFGENQQLTANLPYNSGLAGAVKASVILSDLLEADKILPP